MPGGGGRKLRTGDITTICIFVDAVVPPPPAPAGSTGQLPNHAAAGAGAPGALPAAEEEDALFDLSHRPVRKGASAAKERAILESKAKTMANLDDEADEDFDLESLYTDKTEEQKARIDSAIRASVAFQNVTPAQRELIYKAMQLLEVTEGQWIVRQGTNGDRFYVVEEGSFELRILPEGQEDDGTGGDAVHVYTGLRDGHANPSFGELASF